jgi:HPt (histidine-containing phosphotransfer) domain-containing protein
MMPEVLDPAVWAALRALDDDPAFLDQIIELFSADAKRCLDRLRAGIGAGDRAVIQEVAHSLRGSAGNIGAIEVVAEARALEHLLQSGGSVDAVSGAEPMAAAITRAIEALALIRSRPPD